MVIPGHLQPAIVRPVGRMLIQGQFQLPRVSSGHFLRKPFLPSRTRGFGFRLGKGKKKAHDNNKFWVIAPRPNCHGHRQNTDFWGKKGCWKRSMSIEFSKISPRSCDRSEIILCTRPVGYETECQQFLCEFGAQFVRTCRSTPLANARSSKVLT